MHLAIQVVRLANLIAFVALFAVAWMQWRSQRERPLLWAAAAFVTLAIVSAVGFVIPQTPHLLAWKVVQRFEIAVLVLFPYLLFRFTLAFGRTSRRLYRFVSTVTVVLVVWTFALSHVPAPHQDWPVDFLAYVVLFMVHWSVLSIAVAQRLWAAGRGQPTVARRRMRLLATAAALLTLTLLLSLLGSDMNSPGSLAIQLLGWATAIAFLLGLAPPAIVRIVWRRPEQERLQAAIQNLMTLATSQEQIAERVLEPAAAIVAAVALEIRNDEGRPIGMWGSPTPDSRSTEVEFAGGALTAWTSPYGPIFGAEELALLSTLGALTGLALDRVRLFEQEHAARLALERANHVKMNFIALAAHELRTPVTTIHGFVQTLNHLSGHLYEEQRAELRVALEQQTARMVLLVEQLLDLSRLDADAVEIEPQRFRLRERVEEIVRGAAAQNVDAVEVDVPEGLEADIDPNAFDRILSNLITNAFRYGAPPVTVTAHRSDRHLRISVEDCGWGVAPEFVPDLFERFSRSEGSRSTITGTGLGLAIARSYAVAHSGDLRYEPVSPHGARFQLVLPASALDKLRR